MGFEQKNSVKINNVSTKYFFNYERLLIYNYEKVGLLTSRNIKAMCIAIIAGILLLIAGVSGLALWETIKNFVINYVMDNGVIQIVFAVLIFIASLGGIAVIAGGLLIGKNKVGTGKFLITLGAGFGLIGLIFSIVVAYAERNLTLGSFFSIGAIGLILSIVARIFAKKE
jgi:hypothetical protein